MHIDLHAPVPPSLEAHIHHTPKAKSGSCLWRCISICAVAGQSEDYCHVRYPGMGYGDIHMFSSFIQIPSVEE